MNPCFIPNNSPVNYVFTFFNILKQMLHCPLIFLYPVQLWLPSVSTTFRKWSAHAWCCRLNHVNFLLQLLCCQLVFACQLQPFSQLSTLFLPLQSQQDDHFILRQQLLNAFQKYFEVIMAEQTIFTIFLWISFAISLFAHKKHIQGSRCHLHLWQIKTKCFI